MFVDRLDYPFGIVTGINADSTTGLFATEDASVLLKSGNGNLLENHGGSRVFCTLCFVLCSLYFGTCIYKVRLTKYQVQSRKYQVQSSTPMPITTTSAPLAAV